MMKVIAALGLAGLLNITTVFAADTPKTGADTTPAPATSSTASSSCTQDGLAAMVTQAGTLADKEKQRMTIGHLQLAQKSLNQKDLDGCAMHMKEASANLNNSTTK